MISICKYLENVCWTLLVSIGVVFYQYWYYSGIELVPAVIWGGLE
jgi:hypothetical protein